MKKNVLFFVIWAALVILPVSAILSAIWTESVRDVLPICPRGHYGVGQKKKRGSVGAAGADTNSLGTNPSSSHLRR